MRAKSWRRAERTVALLAPLALVLGTFVVRPAQADPCGMVPPVYTGPGDPIERVGAQQTYVFYDKGIETFVIRPGFKGKVEQFGMLIPFPTPPALRKVDDNIFAHIAAAIDPPEVRVYVQRYRRMPRRRAMAPTADKAARGGAGLAVDEVRVLRQEAVGMYEVAVLEAGSAGALNRWMDDHGYKYPKGMDEACNDYVKLRWCFVAVKTRVGKKSNVDPRPGMRRAKASFPAGGSFNGHVQGMGFRFKSKELVVPMRLSAFNKGRLRNVVYILARGPKKIRSMPQKDVRRQLSGRQLYNNMTRPLPLRVIGGTIRDLRPWQKSNLKSRRNPVPHNGLASELFAADLLAAQKRRLAHPFEEKEKTLLNIGERLGLRGAEIDRLHTEVLDKERNQAVSRALASVRQMTMTVVDADFPRQLLASENLTFGYYRMPRERNNSTGSDARCLGPGGRPPNGKLYHGQLPSDSPLRRAEGRASGVWLGLGAALALLGLLAWRRRGGGALPPLALLLLVGTAQLPGTAQAASLDDLIKDLGDPQRAGPAVAQLARIKHKAVPRLIDVAFDGSAIERRGWAIVALSQIGGEYVKGELTKLARNPNHPQLVRTWAAAAQVELADGVDELFALAQRSSQFPAIRRPIGIRLAALLSKHRGPDRAEKMLEAIARLPQLRQALTPAVLALGARPLVRVMASASNQNARRQAAAYLATLANQKKDNDEVAAEVVNAYRFRKGAKRVPWDGGPLFVPGMRWTEKYARKLVGNLMRWYLWCERRGHTELQRPIHNNLISLALARAAGYRSPGWRSVGIEAWLRTWRQVVGKEGIRRILREQRVLDQKRYQLLLED